MSQNQNRINLKQLRLTVIITLPVDSIELAESAYETIKEGAKTWTNVTISGNVIKMFDPCCGKEGKKGD